MSERENIESSFQLFTVVIKSVVLFKNSDYAFQALSRSHSSKPASMASGLDVISLNLMNLDPSLAPASSRQSRSRCCETCASDKQE